MVVEDDVDLGTFRLISDDLVHEGAEVHPHLGLVVFLITSPVATFRAANRLSVPLRRKALFKPRSVRSAKLRP